MNCKLYNVVLSKLQPTCGSIVPEPGTCEPRVHVHRTRLTRRDTWDLAPDALWASLGRELVAATPDPR